MAADARCQHVYIGAVMPAPSLDTRRKRLRFRSWHRGTREADLILGSFAEANLLGFDETRLDDYEALLDCPATRGRDDVWPDVANVPVHSLSAPRGRRGLG